MPGLTEHRIWIDERNLKDVSPQPDAVRVIAQEAFDNEVHDLVIARIQPKMKVGNPPANDGRFLCGVSPRDFKGLLSPNASNDRSNLRPSKEVERCRQRNSCRFDSDDTG